MSRYTIEGETLTGLADAVRRMRHEKNQMTPAQIEAKIRASRLGIPIDVSCHVIDGRWVRPEEYPDLDSIEITDDFDGVYLTYDLRKTPGYGWIGIYTTLAVSGKKWKVERGHLSNGEFISDYSSENLNSGAYFRQTLDNANGDVQLWKISSSDGHISGCRFCTLTSTSANNLNNTLQPCVERVGRLDWLSGSLTGSHGTGGTYTAFPTVWLERDAVKTEGKGKLTSLGSAWSNAYSLQELDVSGWNTSGWTVTTLASCWAYCRSLKKLDITDWDTDNWPKSANDCFNYWSRELQSAEEIYVPENFYVDGKGANPGINYPNLQKTTGINITVNHSYASAVKLTPQSLINILNRLPSVASSRTITLGQSNKNKLTTEQIAVATQKGWTVAT